MLNYIFYLEPTSMRTRVFILLFPFAVYLTETATYSAVFQDNCAAVTTKTSTCNKTGKQAQCCSKKACNKKTPAKGCTNNPDCTVCPVCLTFIFQSQYEWSATQFSFKQNYGQFNTNYLFSYIPHVWKPPNGYLG